MYNVKYGFKNMSIKLINHTQTTSKVVDNVTWYSNPVLRVSITSDGRVFNNTAKRFLTPTTGGLYSVYYTQGSEYSNPTSFDSLLSHMLGIEKTRGQKIELIDKSKGYVKDNIRVVKHNRVWKARAKRKDTTNTPVKKIPTNLHVLETSDIEFDGFKLKVIKAEHQFITEDGQTFSNKDDAVEHQLLVDKGKNAANIVISHKAGYILAREMFEQHVNVNKVMYKDFKEMLNNNVGIIEMGANPTYRFIDQANMGEYKDLVIGNEYTEAEAKSIASALAKLNAISTELLSIICK